MKLQTNPQENSFTKAVIFFFWRSVKEIRTRLCYYFICLASCYLAIFVSLVSNTIISNSPLMFLKIAEIGNGQIDAAFLPVETGAPSMRYFNMTKIDNLTKPEIGLLAPRLLFSGYARKEYKSLRIDLIVLDSAREKQIGIGTKYDGPVLKKGECAIHESLSKVLKAKKGDEITLEVEMGSYIYLLRTIHSAGVNNSTDVNYGAIDCRVEYVFNTLGGKMPIERSNDKILMELNSFTKYLSEKLRDQSISFRQFLAKFDPYFVVEQVLANQPNREKVYSDSDFYRVQRKIANFVSSIVAKLGFFPLQCKTPILSLLLQLNMGAILLSIILNLIVIILTVVSIFLIYSLLTISVETRTFELSILRMLGLGKFGLAVLVLVQALLFVLPAFILAFISSLLALTYFASSLQSDFGFSFDTTPTMSAIIWAVSIGTIVPAAASIFPIKTALSQNLVECLDMMRSKSQGVHITIEYSKQNSSWNMFAFGIIIIIYGLSIYYFLPLSLLAFNLQLMLWIMLSILLSIVVGLIMLSLNITHLVERLLIFIFLFYESSSMKFLVLKNLIAHKLRNRRTIIIYSLSLGFLLLTIVSYRVEIQNVESTILAKHGSNLELIFSKGNFHPGYEILTNIEDVLITELAKEVEDFALVSEPISILSPTRFESNIITDYGRQVQTLVREQAITANFFEVANNMFLDVFDSNKTSGLSLGEQLYTPRGSQGTGIASVIEHKLDVDANSPKSTFLITYKRRNTDLAFDSRPIFLLSSCPALKMSRTGGPSYQSVVMSIPLLMKLTNITSYSLLKWTGILIKIRGNNMKYFQTAYDRLRLLSWECYQCLTVWSYTQQLKSIESVESYLNVNFIVIIVLFMFLSFFSLMSSMTANILDQSKELAIVRSIGITMKRIVVMHVYEAFVIVMTGSVIGSLIGMLVAYTLCLQRALYTNLPVRFSFPYVHLIVVFVTSIACAVLSTVSPSLLLLRKPISELARM